MIFTQRSVPSMKLNQGSQGRGPDEAALLQRCQNRRLVGGRSPEAEAVADDDAEASAVRKLKQVA